MRNAVQEIFEKATNGYKYAWGIARFEKLFAQDKKLINEDSLCKLGLLYDHLAMRQKTPGARAIKEKKAITLYQKALRRNPDYPKAVWGLGRVWWHRKNAKAIPYAIRAFRLAKKSKLPAAIYAQNVGLVYESLNKYKEAESWLLRGLRENPTDYGPYLNLIVFYRYLNKFEKAKKYARTALRLYTKEPATFKRTPWGKKIRETIEAADRPLPLAKNN